MITLELFHALRSTVPAVAPAAKSVRTTRLVASKLAALLWITLLFGASTQAVGQGDCLELALTHTGLGADPVASPWGNGTLWIEHPLDQAFSNVRSLHTADVDDDGDLDVLGASEGRDEIAWWENVDGAGAVWIKHVVAADFDSAHSVAAADIDGDGDLDVLGTASFGDEITWWENADGGGTAWIEHPLDEGFEGARSAEAADIDGDGDLDILGAANSENNISWWENLDGQGASWTRQVVDGGFEGAWAAHAADIDGDGVIDILAAGFAGDRISWWKNAKGDGSSWTEHEVDGAFDGAASVEAVDVDGDQDLDVIGAAVNGDEIVWWENLDGTGATWAEHVVDGAFDSPYSVRAADLDWDGDLDLLGAANGDDEITWWENEDGIGATWTEHRVAELFDGAITAVAADLDGDGDVDVVGGAWNAGDVSWWENVDADAGCVAGFYRAGLPVRVTAAPAPGWGVESWSGTEDNTSTSTENTVLIPEVDHEVAVHYLEGCFALTLTHSGMGEDPLATPVSSEGCPDGRYVVGAEVELVAQPDLGWQVGGWLGTENDTGTGLTSTVTMPAADHLASVDYIAPCFGLDLGHTGGGADPTADPLNSEGCPVGRYRSSEQVTLTAAPDSGWEVGGWRGTDQDGSRELTNTLTMSAKDHRSDVDYIQCFELTATHTGLGLDPTLSPWGDGTLWTEHPVAGEFDGALSVHAADVDGDGDLDLLGAGVLADALHWWENVDGEGSVWSEHVVASNLNQAKSVYAADVDGDGDVDILGAATWPEKIAWWENVEGAGIVWTQHVVDGSFGGSDVVRRSRRRR